jgi:hypothetical protein
MFKKYKSRWRRIIMSPKLLVIIATGENEKALTGLMYASRTLTEGWMDMFQWFGPIAWGALRPGGVWAVPRLSSTRLWAGIRLHVAA